MSTLNWLTIAIVLAAPWCLVWLWRRDVIAPGALHRLAAAGKLRNPATIPGPVWLVCAFAVFLAMAVGAGMVGSLLPAPPASAPGAASASIPPAHAALRELGGYVLASVIGFLCIAMLLRVGNARSEHEAQQLGLASRGGDALTGLGALVVVLPLCIAAAATASLLAKWLTAEAPEQLAHSTLRELTADRHSWHTWLRTAMVIIGAPVVEELVYRVFLQSAIISLIAAIRARSRGQSAIGPTVAAPGDVFWAIVLSTVVFVAPHAAALNGPVNWHAMPTLTILGLGLGVAYERTRSPLVPIAMHAGFNGLNLALAMLLT